MTAPLGPGQFGDFFAAVNSGSDAGEAGPRPFRWQQRLVDEVVAEGVWPDLIDVPTGAGKTAVLDAAVYAQVLAPDVMPRRIVYVVDRRIVVSQAAQRARRLAWNLATAREGVVRDVADRLRSRAAALGDPVPLLVAELRGGIAQDTTWAMRPDVPAILTSTVDQAGSRLLFRGYGISKGMRPIHAGLLANDVLFVLDEVHLSYAFERLLDRVRSQFRPTGVDGLPERWHVLKLSATPGTTAGRVFRLRDDERDEPLIARRLSASKPVQRVPVKVGSTVKPARLRAALTAAMIDAANERLAAGVQTLGVVANRVDGAVAVAKALTLKGVAPLLLTGRMRPHDRSTVVEPGLARFEAGRVRTSEQPVAVLVATQTVEAGVDLDLDALVTECASLDALRQRFGRVDRLGRVERGSESTSVVVGASFDGDDPVYGPALAATWAAIADWDDFGIDAMAARLPGDLRALIPPRSKPPALLASHLDRLVQTRGVDADPEVARWLHGAQDPEHDVQVVWRTDVDLASLSEAARPEGSGLAYQLLDTVGACPPVSGEAVAVPIHAVRRWLLEEEPSSLSDVEGAEADDAPEPRGAMRPVLRWGGEQPGVLRHPRSIRPGDTLVVPVTYGGLFHGTWDPTSPEPVDDVGHQAAHRGLRAILRLRKSLLGDDVPDPGEDEDAGRDPVAVVREYLAGPVGDGRFDEVVTHLRGAAELEVVACRVQDEAWYVVSSPVPLAPDAAMASVDGDEDDDQSFVGRAVDLEEHLNDVATWAGALASACGLSSALVDDLTLAGRVHDIGKADPRFQSMLRGGVAVVPGKDLLAKSKRTTRDRLGRRRAQERAGYPVGERHEALSVAFMRAYADLIDTAHDPGLVEHLVASHHGWARPFFPPSARQAPVEAVYSQDGVTMTLMTDHDLIDVAQGVPSGFWRQVRRYGWFGEAWLATILRLADHRASEMEQRRPGRQR